MTSFNVLDRHLVLQGKYFLEASAGTGKTFAIEHLVVRLVLQGMPIEQILVVTFTRAATRELKTRIRRSLDNALKELNSGYSTADYLQAIIERGEEEKARQLIEAALICFDLAQIYTIHGFCHRMLSECAFEAGLNLTLSDPDAKEHRHAMREAVLDFLRSGSMNVHAVQVGHLLKKHQRDINRVANKLLKVIEEGVALANVPTFHDHYDKFRSELLQMPRVTNAQFLEDFASLAPHYKRVTHTLHTEQIGVLLEKGDCTPEEFAQLLSGENILAKIAPNNLKVRAKLPEKLHYPGLFDKLRTAWLSSLDEASDAQKIFARIGQDALTFWEENGESEELSPNDLLKEMERCVQNRAFCHAVRKSIRGVIIDEFQDTDPTQWTIFRKLFLEPDAPVEAFYLVGDPKQSIYGFRSADVYTYLSAAHLLGKEAHAVLDTNFRSTPELVAALNTLMATGESWMRLPLTQETLTVAPVKAGRTESVQFADGFGSVHFFFCKGEQGREARWPTLRMEEEAIFPFIAHEILKFPRQTCAILVKDRYQGMRVHAYLQKLGIQAAHKNGRSLVDSPAITTLIQLLDAAIHPNDPSKIKAVLASSLFGWQSHELIGGFDKPELAKIQRHFLHLSDVLERKGFGLFFQEFECDSDMRKLAELLMEEERKNKATPRRLLLFLRELMNTDLEDDERLKPYPNDDSEQVAIMTTHTSKGLEFDIVFALGTSSRHERPEEFVKVKQEGQVRLKSYAEDDPLCQQAAREQDAEKLRQLYVAWTRAKLRLYIPYPIEEEGSVKNGSPLELFFADRTIPEVPSITRSSDVPHVTPVTPSKPKMVAHPILQMVPGQIEILTSFTALAKTHKSEEPAPKVVDSMLPLGAETGVILHTIFEQIFRKGLHHPFEEQRIRGLIAAHIEMTILEGAADEIWSMVQEILTMPMLGTDRLIDVSKVQPEIEFLYPSQNRLIKGFIDLAFAWKGKYYLLDWKSNALEDYSRESMHQAMVKHDYYLQASLYAEALQRYVKLFDTRPWEEIYGGAIYIFLRGRRPFFV